MKKSRINPGYTALFILLFITASVCITTCRDPSNAKDATELPDTPNGDTRLVVAIHDTPFKMQDKTVEALNITVKEMVIIDSGGKHTTILHEERKMDILAITRSDPVVLSDVSVEPGAYSELRLVLKDDSTIKVDGEVFPIKIPSGSQSGLKLKGPFTIPKGKLFRLVIDFVASESVHWNKGQGYMLKPVLHISSDAEIIGIFRGNLSVAASLGPCETLAQLYSDNTARLRVADYPNYSLYCDYAYNSVLKQLKMTHLSLDAPGLSRRELKEVMKKMPNDITLPVKQWSIDSIIAVDINGRVCNLYRVDSFDFSQGVSFTEFTLNIDYPDASKTGKDVLTEIQFIDTGMPAITRLAAFEGSRITDTIPVLNSYIQGSSTRIRITSYLFENPGDMNVEAGIYANLPALMMADCTFSKSTENPWQQPFVFTLIRDREGQEFTVSFPPRLNIRMNHDNFTNNKPVITWNPYPGATNGYFVLVLVKNKSGTPSDNGNAYYEVAYHAYTMDTQVQVVSNLVTFTNPYQTTQEIQPSIQKSDIIRIEVFVLDGSNHLDTKYFQGAFLMDTTTIVR